MTSWALSRWRLLLLPLLLSTTLACGGSTLYRIAQINSVSAESFLTLVTLEKQWADAGYIDRDVHARWLGIAEVWGHTGLSLAEAVKSQNEGASLQALRELAGIADLLLSTSGVISRFPEDQQVPARRILRGIQTLLTIMTHTLEASHVPARLDPRHLALVRGPDLQGDQAWVLDRGQREGGLPIGYGVAGGH